MILCKTENPKIKNMKEKYQICIFVFIPIRSASIHPWLRCQASCYRRASQSHRSCSSTTGYVCLPRYSARPRPPSPALLRLTASACLPRPPRPAAAYCRTHPTDKLTHPHLLPPRCKQLLHSTQQPPAPWTRNCKRTKEPRTVRPKSSCRDGPSARSQRRKSQLNPWSLSAARKACKRSPATRVGRRRSGKARQNSGRRCNGGSS